MLSLSDILFDLTDWFLRTYIVLSETGLYYNVAYSSELL